jgi:hypothetical protein
MARGQMEVGGGDAMAGGATDPPGGANSNPRREA